MNNKLFNSFFIERSLVFTFLLILLLYRINLSIELNRLMVFEQYNVFFDADPNQYISAFANGWGFGQTIHPGIALFFNIPIRAIDYILSNIGLVVAGSVRGSLPLFLAPIFSVIGGVFWWLAAFRANISLYARLAGLLITQLSFSQIIFSVVPESYAISGALLSVLLYLCIRVEQAPESLNDNKVKAQWMLLACIMSGVTITNGFMCILAWMAIRIKRASKARVILEAAIAKVILIVSIISMIMAHNLIYKPENKSTQEITSETISWTQRYINEATIWRAVEMPHTFMKSIAPTEVEKVSNSLANEKHIYQYGFSLETNAIAKTTYIYSWTLFLLLIYLISKKHSKSMVFAAIIAVFIFNIIIHSLFGREIFLYSQHWLPFLGYFIVMHFQDHLSQKKSILLFVIVAYVSVLNAIAWDGVMRDLQNTYNKHAQVD